MGPDLQIRRLHTPCWRSARRPCHPRSWLGRGKRREVLAVRQLMEYRLGKQRLFSRSNEESTNVVSNPKWSAAFRLASLSGIQCFFRRELFKLLFNDSTFKL